MPTLSVSWIVLPAVRSPHFLKWLLHPKIITMLPWIPLILNNITQYPSRNLLLLFQKQILWVFCFVTHGFADWYASRDNLIHHQLRPYRIDLGRCWSLPVTLTLQAIYMTTAKHCRSTTPMMSQSLHRLLNMNHPQSSRYHVANVTQYSMECTKEQT